LVSEAAPTTVREKHPGRVAGGKRTALKRWGDPANRRVVRLADLLPEEAEVIRSLLRLKGAREQSNAPASSSAEASMSEVRHAAQRPTG
jgi:hypothetical protein